MMNSIRFVTLSILALTLCVTLASAQTVDVYGQVRFYEGSCSIGTGLNDVEVLLYDNAGFYASMLTYTDEEFAAAHGLSSPDGIFYFDDVPYSLDYWLEVIPPEGITLLTSPEMGSWWNANPRAVGDDFYRCFLITYESHTMGFWKHQATVAVTGRGHAQVPADELQDILDAIFDQFNGAAYFPIEGVSSVGGAPLTPQDMLNTFGLPNGGSAGMVNKCKKQLLAVLLDVCAGWVSLDQIVSEDDRTVSEAIAFGADMITNGGAAVGTAKDALDYINNNWLVPDGWIPDGYGSIYGEETTSFGLSAGVPSTVLLVGNYPNPFNPETTIQYMLESTSPVELTIYDATGRLVATLVDGWRDAGTHQVTFDGSSLASGVYLYRLSAGDLNASGKMVLMK